MAQGSKLRGGKLESGSRSLRLEQKVRESYTNREPVLHALPRKQPAGDAHHFPSQHPLIRAHRPASSLRAERRSISALFEMQGYCSRPTLNGRATAWALVLARHRPGPEIVAAFLPRTKKSSISFESRERDGAGERTLQRARQAHGQRMISRSSVTQITHVLLRSRSSWSMSRSARSSSFVARRSRTMSSSERSSTASPVRGARRPAYRRRVRGEADEVMCARRTGWKVGEGGRSL